MTFWSEVFLGVIALAMLTMAAVHVGVVVYGWALARRVNRLLAQVEQEMKPLAKSLNAIAVDTARISGMAAGQFERVDRLVTGLAAGLDETATTVQDAFLKPLREGAAMLAGVRAVIDVFRDLPNRPAASRRGRSDEEDALFIG